MGRWWNDTDRETGEWGVGGMILTGKQESGALLE